MRQNPQHLVKCPLPNQLRYCRFYSSLIIIEAIEDSTHIRMPCPTEKHLLFDSNRDKCLYVPSLWSVQ